MENVDIKTSVAVDDDEDLEQLRLAALKSLKKPLVVSEKVNIQQKPTFKNGLNRGNRGSYHGRSHRNGQFNHRTRNTNLIAVPIITTDTEDITNSSSKLVLPQDRYYKSNSNADEKLREQSSKFNRYNDKSDSESSESDARELIEGKKPLRKLEKANSLEALMQELEKEIDGRSNSEEKVIVKVRKVKKRMEEVQEDKPKPMSDEEVEERRPLQTCEIKIVPTLPAVIVQQQPPQYIPLPVQYCQTSIHPYNSIPPVIPYETSPITTRYERVPSPLTINTDLLNTTVTAPLSPRSAAFVLQNREIIERRKRRLSPSIRRSYSISPSPPRYRRSRTKSRSPVKIRTNASPPSTIVRRKISPEKKSSVYGRLGTRIEETEQLPQLKHKRSCSKSPIERKILNPILEARKKKFESNELKMKEGVIRLKPKNDEMTEDDDNGEEEKEKEKGKEEDEEEEEEEEKGGGGGGGGVVEEPDDVIDVNVGDLFSDDETDNENEGRFKGNINKETEETHGGADVVTFERFINKKNEQKRKLSVKKSHASTRLILSAEKQKILSPVSALSEKKIEIKIRNPTKYEEKNELTKKLRKVELGAYVEQDVERGEIVAEVENDNVDVVGVNEGDLRAQLSRKRAERQNKISVVSETVASRLLQSALESAVFRKTATKKSSKHNSAAQKDGKLSIHSRLGVPMVEVKSATAKKKRKKKSRGSEGLEQAHWMELPVF